MASDSRRRRTTMPLIPVGPGYRQPAPAWTRNPQLIQAEMSNQMYPLINTPTVARTAPPRQRPVAGGGGDPNAAQRTAAVLQGRQYTPPKPLPMDAGPSKVNSLANDYQRQINRANKANEQRYNEILQGYRDREKAALDQANLVRDQRYRDESARIQNDLISRGLANSSLAGKNLFQSYERNAQYPMAVQMQTSGDTLGFMERRNDVGPDPNQLLQLAQLQGQTDQYQNQNIGQTVSQIGQAVDQRVAQGSNTPSPPRMVNVPMMGAPVYGGQMGGYPMQQYPMPQYGQQPMQVGWQGSPQPQQQNGMNARQQEIAAYNDQMAARRREAAIANSNYVRERQKTDAMMKYPWFFGVPNSNQPAPSGTPVSARETGVSPPNPYAGNTPIPPSWHMNLSATDPYWWWNDPNYTGNFRPGNF